MKPDERNLMLRLMELHAPGGRTGEFQNAVTVAVRSGMNANRAEYLLNKWSAKGWWEYGVSVRLGWFTVEGLDHARRLR